LFFGVDFLKIQKYPWQFNITAQKPLLAFQSTSHKNRQLTLKLRLEEPSRRLTKKFFFFISLFSTFLTSIFFGMFLLYFWQG
jgi:hypothetical protein